jgi:hypothetical protein
MSTLSIKDFLELINSTPIKVALFIVICCLIFISIIFIKEQLEVRKKYKKSTYTKIREIPADITMGLDELLNYFKSHYNFNISEDSYKFIDKARELVNKIEYLQNDLNNDLLAAQTGILINKNEVIDKINEVGGLIDVVDNELDLMFRLFKHLKEHDSTYEEELNDIKNLKDHYQLIEKRLLVLCINLISQLPDNS